MRLNNLGDFATFRGRVFFFRVERKRLQITRKWLHPALANQATKFCNKKHKLEVTPNPCGRIEAVLGKMLLFWPFERPQSLGTLPLRVGGCYWTQRPPKKKHGLTASRPKTGTDIMLADFRYAGVMIRYQTIESIEWFFFKNNPHSMNSKHLKNKSRVTTHKSTSFQPLPTISLALDAWVLFPYSRTAACCGDRGEESASSRNGLVKLDLMVYHFQPTNLSYGSCVLFLGVGKGNHFDYTFNEFQW